ncbi:hypothetical protein [uncultured Bradyrhizobium sp.]|jgi:hypothetical protein|uniref:hypothetical protein n=1 Tax=uncultured Bradyrhizobium sp. TaxID=199684 RepID=UPI00260E94E7|nr:hypothetical protein [uncultured Bradyrhizobium sp.]
MKADQRLVGGVAFAAITIFLFASIAIFGGNDYNVGTDLGIHLGFAREIARVGWPLPTSSAFLPMAHYPPLSHLLALCAGLIAGSSLYGISVVTASAFVLVYICAARLMQREGLLQTIMTFVIFLGLSIALRKWRFLEGGEVVENFFFAQFVATGLMLACATLLLESGWSFGRWMIAAALMTHLLGWAYGPSAIEFALTCTAFQGLAFLQQPSMRLFWRALLACTLLNAIAVVHPTMIGALAIAANDGGISIEGHSLSIAFVALVLGSIIVAAFHLCKGLAGWRTILSLNIGVSAICAAQFLAFQLVNVGSIYAVKKYGFLVGTLALMTWSILLAELAQAFFDLRLRWSFHPAYRWVAICFLGLLMLPVLTVGRPHTGFAALQQYGAKIDELVQRMPELVGSTVSWNRRMTPHVNYTAGVGWLAPAQAIADQHAIFEVEPRLTGAAKFVIVDAETAAAYSGPCVIGATADISAVRASCWR